MNYIFIYYVFAYIYLTLKHGQNMGKRSLGVIREPVSYWNLP